MDECETVVDRSMTETENLKAVKHGKAADEMRPKDVVNDDGTLSKLSLGKLDKTLSTFADAARDMEAQLMTATSNANIISPMLVHRLAAVKCEVEAESAALILYKESNREDDTLKVCQNAIAKLNAARPQFKVIGKMLKAMDANPIPAEQQADQ